MNGVAGPPIGGTPMGGLADPMPAAPSSNGSAFPRPVSNPAALQRPGMGINDAAASFNNRVRAVSQAGISQFGAQSPSQFQSYNGTGNAQLNGQVPTKVFNGVSPSRVNPNPLARYDYQKHLREF